MTRRNLAKTFILTGENDEKLKRSDILAINLDLENLFTNMQNLQTQRKTITGSRGANAALASLITALAELGIIKDITT